jgi:hypothetical protein
MTKRVADLTGPDLDRAVANAHGMMLYHEDWQPSRNWAQGGPIIERMTETGYFRAQYYGVKWSACLSGQGEYDHWFDGSSFLEAAMRSYVASRLGEEIDDESI